MCAHTSCPAAFHCATFLPHVVPLGEQLMPTTFSRNHLLSPSADDPLPLRVRSPCGRTYSLTCRFDKGRCEAVHFYAHDGCSSMMRQHISKFLLMDTILYLDDEGVTAPTCKPLVLRLLSGVRMRWCCVSLSPSCFATR